MEERYVMQLSSAKLTQEELDNIRHEILMANVQVLIKKHGFCLTDIQLFLGIERQELLAIVKELNPEYYNFIMN